MVLWGMDRLKCKSFERTICKLAWSLVVYYIWIQRNALVCSSNVKSEVAILLLIRRVIKA